MADELLELLAEGITIRNDIIQKMSHTHVNLREEIHELLNFNMTLRGQLDQQIINNADLLRYRQELEILHLQNHQLLLELQRRGGVPPGFTPPINEVVPPTSDSPASSTVSGPEPTPKRKGRKGKKKDQPSTSTGWE